LAAVPRTVDGIRLGSKLTEVEKLNGGPFVVTGFEWVLGGMMIDNPNGRLSKALTLHFSPMRELPALERSQIMGDRRISSSHPPLRKSAPELFRLGVRLNR